MLNYSFWADEAFVSSVASQFVRGQMTFLQMYEFPGVTYQRLNALTMATSFKIFGISEFAARFPSILAYITGVILIFFVAKKISNKYAAWISTTLYAASHLNLAYATQAKPYSAVESMTLAVILLFLLLREEKKLKKILLYNASIILLCATATLFHLIGFLLWLFYFIYILSALTKIKRTKKALLLFFIPGFLLIFLATVFVLPEILKIVRERNMLINNHLYQFVRLFGYQYFFITLFTLGGFVLTFTKNKLLSIATLTYCLALFVLATFEQYIFNIRYVLSLFGIMFMYFGVFWGVIASRYFPKREWLIVLAVVGTLYATGYKVVRTPQSYYNPNIDKYGDVQIANYKDFYAELKKLHPDYKNLPIFNNTFDVEGWYFGRYSNAYFMKSVKEPQMHPIAKVKIYGSLSDFKREMGKYPKGLVIVEDWESFLPEDIKQYVKKNLKLEYRVESLKEAPDDPWPLALYSWGIEK